MANKLIQLKDGNDNAFPNTFMGSFIPKLYDLDTYICDLPQASYIRIGDLGIAFMPYDWGNIINSHLSEINTMVQIRNIPFNTNGAILYESQHINKHSIQCSYNYLYFRPNINKNTSDAFVSSDQLTIFGKFN